MLTLRIAAAASLLSTFASAEFNFSQMLTRAPNETRSITFRPFPEDPDLKEIDWTWRVNITDVPLPNQEITYPVPASKERSPDSRGIAITYDLSWPGGGDLQDTVSEAAPKFCAGYPFTISRLPNVTNLWPDENTESPDCAPVLGQACVDALLAQAKPELGSCHVSGPAWHEIPECASSFGYGHNKSNTGWYGSIDSGLDQVESGEPFNSITFIYNGKEDKAVYESAVNMLQIVLLHSQPPSEAYANASELERAPTLACMRVKTDKLALEEVQAEDGGSAAPRGGHVDWLVALGSLSLATAVLAIGL